MKECPNCGSILADFEPYCTNCGFDPDYDRGYWKKGGYSAKMNYYHGDHIKDSDLNVLGNVAQWAVFSVVMIILMFMIIEFYVLPFLSNIWQNNPWVIIFLIFIILVIAIAYTIYQINIYLGKKPKKRQDKIKQEKALKIKKQKRKQNIMTYDPSTSKYTVCMKCGYENPKKLSKCWDCGADLKKQKIANLKNSTNTFLKSEYENKTPRQDSYKNSKYGRCPECNSLVSLQDGRGRCRYCGFYVDLSKINSKHEDIKINYNKEMSCPVCGNTIKKQAVRCKYCKTILKKY